MIEVTKIGKRYEIDCSCGARLRYDKEDKIYYGSTTSYVVCPKCNRNLYIDDAVKVNKVGEEE